MSEFFLTDPDNMSDEDNDKSNSQYRMPTFDFKEQVVSKLQTEWNVPLRTAQVAVIDLKKISYMCYHYKLNPRQTAEMMISEVERLYKYADGKWHYV